MKPEPCVRCGCGVFLNEMARFPDEYRHFAFVDVTDKWPIVGHFDGYTWHYAAHWNASVAYAIPRLAWDALCAEWDGTPWETPFQALAALGRALPRVLERRPLLPRRRDET